MSRPALATDDGTLTSRVARAMREREASWRAAQPFATFGPPCTLRFLTGAKWRSGRSELAIDLTAYPSRDDAVRAFHGRAQIVPRGPVVDVDAPGERARRVTYRGYGWLLFQSANVVAAVIVSPIDARDSAPMTDARCIGILTRVAGLVAEQITGEVVVNECENRLLAVPRPAASTPDAMLRQAIASGCLADVERALTAGADANARYENSGPALLLAIASGRRAVVRRLLAAGADARQRGAISYAFSPPPCYAEGEQPTIVANSLAIVDDLIEAGASVNLGRDEIDRRTPLHDLAVYNADDGSPAVLIRGLVERGADPNARDNMGRTALMLAADVLHPTVMAATIQALIAGGAEVNARDNDGKTALDHAREHARKYPEYDFSEVYRILEDAGAVE